MYSLNYTYLKYALSKISLWICSFHEVSVFVFVFYCKDVCFKYATNSDSYCVCVMLKCANKNIKKIAEREIKNCQVKRTLVASSSKCRNK